MKQSHHALLSSDILLCDFESMAISWSQIPVYPIGIIANFHVMVVGKQVDDMCCRTGIDNTTRLLIPGLQRHTRLLSFNKIIWQLSLEKTFTVEKKYTPLLILNHVGLSMVTVPEAG